MSEVDYEELLRSPLDDADKRVGPGWATLVAGVVVGLIAGYLATGWVDGGSEVAVTTSSSTTTTTTIPEVNSPDYPAGYVEVAPSLAAEVNEVILGDNLITLSLTTAVERGQNPTEVGWPIGGVWILESATGTAVESSRVVVGRYSPGAFSIHFPAEAFAGETEFVRLNLVERWDTDRYAGSIETPFDGEPFTAPEILSTPINQDVTLFIPDLRLGRFLGVLGWETTGAEFGTTVRIVATLYDENGDEVGSYQRVPEIIDPGESGYMDIHWGGPFPIGQEGAVSVALEYTVGVVERTPISVEFDIADVPVGR